MSRGSVVQAEVTKGVRSRFSISLTEMNLCPKSLEMFLKFCRLDSTATSIFQALTRFSFSGPWSLHKAVKMFPKLPTGIFFNTISVSSSAIGNEQKFDRSVFLSGFILPW